MVEKKPKFDIDRRTHMFRFGLDESESSSFLKNSRAALILAGAKNVTLFQTHDLRIDLISKLKGKSLEVLKRWALTNLIQEHSFIDLSGTLATLSEAMADSLYDGKNLKNLWRPILLAYFQPETQAQVEEFITSEMKSTKNKIVLLGVKDNIGEGYDIVTVEPVGQDTAPKSGFFIKKTVKFSREIVGEAGELPVLAASKNILPSGQFFVHIEGVISGDNVIALNESESDFVFPETGDATGYPDVYSGMSPPKGMLAIWRVKYHNAERKTRFLISDFISRVYFVNKVPHASTDHDRVRSWIQNQYVGRAFVYPVFELSDGLIIKASGDPTEFVNYDFNTLFNGYLSHEAISWQGQLIVIKPFPAADIKYDCATINSAIKRLFKVRSEMSRFPVLTKGNLQDLAFLASNESDDGLISQSTTRAIKSIEGIFSARENVEIFFKEILNMPEVVSRINDEIEKVRAEQKTLLEAGKTELAQLAASKQKLLNEIKAANQNVKDQALELTREMRKAFEKASKDGIKTLSEVAVFQSFFGESNASNQAKSPEKINLEIPSAKEITTTADVTTAINLKALQSGLSPSYLRVATTSLLSSGVLGLIGSESKQIVAPVSEIISAGKYCFVSISADMFSIEDLLNAPVAVSEENLPPLSLGQLMECYQNISRPLSIELKGFNRFPPETVLNEILTMTDPNRLGSDLAWRDPSGIYHSLKVKAPVFFFLTFASGRSTFPISGDQAFVLPIVDTDLMWPDKFEATSRAVISSGFVGGSLLRDFRNELTGIEGSQIPSVNFLSAMKIRQLTYILEKLGDPDKDAQLLSYLTYSLGRYDTKDLVVFAESSSSDLSNFISAYLKNSNLKNLKNIFEI
jgi:hypothetical protein